jgi:hypothetical protein
LIDRENGFELVFCENGSKFHPEGPINQRSPYNKSLYPIKELTPPDYLRRITGVSAAPADPKQNNQNSSINQTQLTNIQLTYSPSPRKISKPNANEGVNMSNVARSSDFNETNVNISVKMRYKVVERNMAERNGASPLRHSVNGNVKVVNNFARIQNLKNTGSQPNLNEVLESDRSGKFKMNPVPGNLNELKVDGLKPDEQDIHLRSNSVEEKTKYIDAYSPKNNIETIYKNLHLALIYKSSSNVNTIASNLARVLACLSNWEILSDKHVSLACKTLNLIAQSGANFLLAEQNNIIALSNLLNSPNVKSEIKFSVVEAIAYLARDLTLKKKLMCNKLVHDLINIVLSSCVQKPEYEYTKPLKLAALKCLETLGGVFNRKIYIPGETRELDKIRNFFTAQGGIIAMWLLGTRSLEDDIREIAVKSFLSNLELQDWDKQIQVLKLLKSIPPNELPKPEEKPITNIDPDKSKIYFCEIRILGADEIKPVITATEEGSKADIIFYKSGDFQLMEKAFGSAKLDKTNIEKIITFPM